jgi:uncharacterized protein (DUF2062 family)
MWHRRAVSSASALAFAAVLACAAIVARLTAPLALTVVFPFTGVLGCVLIGRRPMGRGPETRVAGCSWMRAGFGGYLRMQPRRRAA